MNAAELLAHWFDTRPGEARRVVSSFFGAFCAISFLTLARALRNAFYVTTFDVTTLPNMTIAVAVLTLPTVGLFGRAMGGRNPHVVYSGFLVVLAVVIGSLFVLFPAAPEAANVSFYLITVLGGSLLTSGFWMVTSEHFSLRQAKRLFGVIGAGGTLGAMLTGLLVSRLTRTFSTLQLVPGLILLVVGMLVLQRTLPTLAPHHHHQEEESKGTPMREGLELILSRPHLRNIALIVLFATMVATILDYQFIEVVSGTFDNADQMAGFFAAFYGLTGVLAFLIQVVLAARLMSGAGIALSLAVLPSLLLVGSAAMLLVPASILFWTTTAVRGADNALRKSLHRSVLEYLYVPVPPTVRRKTKAFIDSVVDNMGGGLGAGLLFLWVTWAGFSSLYLSLAVVGLSLAFIFLSFRMGSQYKRTVRARLSEGGESLEAEIVASGFDARNLLTVTMTRLDLEEELAKAGVNLGAGGTESVSARPEVEATIEERLASSEASVVAAALRGFDDWEQTHVPALIRLLAQGRFNDRAVDIMRSIGEESTRQLIEVLNDENADFVIRRRIPRALSEVDTPEADQALLEALAAGRFEVRYRAAIALVRRREAGLAVATGDWQQIVWEAVEREVGRDRPIWELQRILDGAEAGSDDFVNERVGVRGELSLEHTFRQLSLVLDADAMRTAFHGIILDDENLKGLSLEYLEQVLPPNIRERLWPFIGDISDYQRDRAIRGVDEVVHELSQTGATLFGGAEERAKLRDALKTYDEEKRGNGDSDGT